MKPTSISNETRQKIKQALTRLIPVFIVLWVFFVSDYSMYFFGSIENVSLYSNPYKSILFWLLMSFMQLGVFTLIYLGLKRKQTISNQLSRVFKSIFIIAIIGISIVLIRQYRETKYLEDVGIEEYGICHKKVKRLGSHLVIYQFGHEKTKQASRQVDISDYKFYNKGDTIFVIKVDPKNPDIFKTVDFWE